MNTLVKPLKAVKKYIDPLRLRSELEHDIANAQKEEIKQKSAKLKNHLQEFLVNEIKQYLDSGMDKKKLKDYLLKQGYKSTDVNQAFKFISERPKEVNTKSESYIEENKKAHQFLKVIKSKSIPTTKLYKELGVSAREGNELKQALLFQGLIEISEKRDKKGWSKIIKPTQKALDLLG